MRTFAGALALLGGGTAFAACGPAQAPADLAPATAEAPAPGTLTAAQRQALSGTYALNTPDGRVTFRVFEEDGGLMGQPSGQSAVRLIHEGDNVFRTVSGTPYTLTFFVEGGQANRVTVRSQTEVMEAVRIP